MLYLKICISLLLIQPALYFFPSFLSVFNILPQFGPSFYFTFSYIFHCVMCVRVQTVFPMVNFLTVADIPYHSLNFSS